MFKDWGIDLETLATVTNRPEADPFNLLCHFAYNAPLRTRRERAEHLKADKKDFFEKYGPEARSILSELLDKYAEHGMGQFAMPDLWRFHRSRLTGTSWRSQSSSAGRTNSLRQCNSFKRFSMRPNAESGEETGNGTKSIR